MNLLPSILLYVLAVATLVPYAAAQPLRHSSSKGFDASGIDAVSVLSACFILMSSLLTSSSDHEPCPPPLRRMLLSLTRLTMAHQWTRCVTSEFVSF